jgi:hypothetical protein
VTGAQPDREPEDAAEAERLAQLPREIQEQALALIRAPADDSRLPERDRREARDRSDALRRHLRRLGRKS